MRRPAPLAFGALILSVSSPASRGCCACGANAAGELCVACTREAAVGPGFRHGAMRGRFHLGLYSVARAGGPPQPTRLARALARFKYARDRRLGRRLARLFASHAPSLPSSCDLIVPLPLHPAKLRQRGFNQAAWLARAAARTTRLPLCAEALHRIEDRSAQASLGATARRRLSSGTFAASGRLVAGARVLVIDDVLTTGATAAAATRALAHAGARRVDVAVLLAVPGPRAFTRE